MKLGPIDILMVTYNRHQFTYEVLRRIREHTKTPYRIIVVDNFSKERRYLKDWSYEGLIDVLILLDKNYGLEPAKMYGMPFIKSPLFVNTDNDCLPEPVDEQGKDWLSRLVNLMNENNRFAAIACPPQVFIGANKSELFTEADEILEWDHVGGSLRLMQTDLVRKVGGWRTAPKDMEEANRSEEWHIGGKLRDAGYKLGYARDIECFHMFGTNENWGYDESIEHYHRDIHPKPTDEMYGTKEDWYKERESTEMPKMQE